MGRQSRDVSVDVDTIIGELGGGSFHVISFAFIALAIFFNSITSASFIFTARDTQYRCFVPGCDSESDQYDAQWIHKAITHGMVSKCERYNATCSDLGAVEDCDRWVYGQGETIVKEYDIACQEWKRALVGTVNSVGQFICLSYSGLISDTIGRKSVMVYATVFSGIIGVIQSYASDYWTFLLFEFLVAAVGSGAYSASFILGIEILVPEKRVLGSMFMNIVCGVATVALGVAAWVVPNWKYLLRIIYFPSLIMIPSFWLIPESIRWLIVKGRRSEAGVIIKKAAKLNGATLSEKLSKYLERLSIDSVEVSAEEYSTKKLPLKAVLKSNKLLIRLWICAFCWMTNAFVYYGLSLNSVSLFGNENNPYINFILVSLIELPAQVLVVMMLNSIGRRMSLCTSLLGSAFSCFAFILIPSDKPVMGLVVYLLGKLFITVSFSVVYIYTTELFPTSLRHSIMACCSMLGRIGGMLAPQTPLLTLYYSGLPMVFFGMTTLISGMSVLLFPETLNIKLPDTIEEAENIGIKTREPKV